MSAKNPDGPWGRLLSGPNQVLVGAPDTHTQTLNVQTHTRLQIQYLAVCLRAALAGLSLLTGKQQPLPGFVDKCSAC